MKKLVMTLVFGTTMLSMRNVSAQQPWQQLQMPTADEVAAVWKNPPSEYGPEPYFDMSGTLDRAQLTRDLDAMKALGFRAVTPQAAVNMPFGYLSPEYFAYFKMLVEEAKKREMRVWIVDDAGYPSGFAGGKFTREKPELRMQTLNVWKTFDIRSGAKLNEAVPETTVAVTAVKDDGTTIAVPVVNGTASFTAPAGAWQVIVVEHRFDTAPTRSSLNPKLATEPRPNTNSIQAKDKSSSLFDYLNPAAALQFLEFTHEQYKKYVGEEFGKTILGFRGDEPDYSVAGLPWTPAFFAKFGAIKGYDIRPYLATFLLKTPPLTAEQTRARADYWDVFSRLFAESFFKVQADWCAANHMEYQVHINSEEREMNLTRTDGDYFRDMRAVEVPGIDMTRHQIWTDTISDFPRLASSEAHVYGKPRAFTETFASSRPMPDEFETKYILDEQLVRGVNLVELMYYPSSGTGGRPAMAYMQRPSFPALLEYVRRLSYLMSMGRPTASVALYLPSSSMWMRDEASDVVFVSAERLLSEHQINFDIVSEDALGKDLIAGQGTFETLSGNRFRTVIVPSASLLNEAAVERLRTFAAGGGKVLFLGRTPSLIWVTTILNARAATATDFAWATFVPIELPPTPTPSDDPPAHPPEPMVVAPEILQALNAAVTSREVTLDKPDTALKVMPRRWKDADVFLFFNEGTSKTDDFVTLTTEAKSVQAWDPQTGAITSVTATKTKIGLSIHLPLDAYQTRVLVAR